VGGGPLVSQPAPRAGGRGRCPFFCSTGAVRQTCDQASVRGLEPRRSRRPVVPGSGLSYETRGEHGHDHGENHERDSRANQYPCLRIRAGCPSSISRRNLSSNPYRPTAPSVEAGRPVHVSSSGQGAGSGAWLRTSAGMSSGLMWPSKGSCSSPGASAYLNRLTAGALERVPETQQ
jgi:hypothetical protein